MKLSLLNRIKNVSSPSISQRICTHLFSTAPRESLYKRISPLGGLVSITPILDQWVEQGNEVTQPQLQNIVKELRYYNRYKHALEVSTWMTEKMYMPLSPEDVASRMNLIWRIHGIGEVENCFHNCSSKLKGYKVYMALLNCYAHEKAVEKAEETFQMMKDNKMIRTPMGYNIMINLYNQIGNHEKMDELMVEMTESGIDPDNYTLRIRFVAYASVSDIAGMNKIARRMKSAPGRYLDLEHCSVVAEGYLKVGQTDEAVKMLKKIEEQIILRRGNKKQNFALSFLLKSYARAGMKSQVFHVWELYKRNELAIYNHGYMSMISSLLSLGDIEATEKIYEEWESRNLTYDHRIPNLLIDAYCRNDLLEKAESLIDRVEAKGNEPSADAWCSLTNGYLKSNQIGNAKEALKGALSASQTGRKPSKEHLDSCLQNLEEKQDKELTDFKHAIYESITK